MATEQQIVGPDEASMPVWKRKGIVKWKDLAPELDKAFQACNVEFQIKGASKSERTPGGVYFEIDGDLLGSSAWKCIIKNNEEDVPSFFMGGGAYNDLAIDEYELGTGSGWAYLEVTWNVSDVADGYLLSASLTTAIVEVASSVPASNPGAGVWRLPLVQFAGSTVLSQARQTSFNASVCDDGTGNGTGAHQSD